MQAKVNSQEKSGEKNFNYNMTWQKGDVIFISPEAELREAVRLMRDRQVGNLLVMENGNLRGILTDRDIALSLLQGDVQKLKVYDVMSESVVCAYENDDFFKLVNLMSQYGVTRLPLKTADEKVFGVVTAKNLLEILAKSLFEITQISEKQQQNEGVRRH